MWYAENEIGKPAAVKILNENLSRKTQIVERFHNEALVMVKLNHPNIRQVYGYGYLGDRHCIIMEYLNGDDLEAMLKAGRRFTDEEVCRWWNQTVDALNYTHAMGIVHRDIKPSNIFLDNMGNIKLLDFGIAKVKESMSMTRTGMMMGTLMYMSPEQVKDPKRVDAKSDICNCTFTGTTGSVAKDIVGNAYLKNSLFYGNVNKLANGTSNGYDFKLSAVTVTNCFYERADGKDPGPDEVELPYDMSSDYLEITDEDYGIFYMDCMDNPKNFDEKYNTPKKCTVFPS